MKKLLPLFALVCFAANAGKTKADPQIVVACTALDAGICDSTQDVSLVLTGLDPHKLYEVAANGAKFDPGGILNPDSDTVTIDISGLASGPYSFTLYQVNHNGTPRVEFETVAVTIQDPLAAP